MATLTAAAAFAVIVIGIIGTVIMFAMCAVEKVEQGALDD